MPRRRLSTVIDIRKLLAKKIMEFVDGNFDGNMLKILTGACHVLGGLVKDSELEQRIQKLERMVENEHTEED